MRLTPLDIREQQFRRVMRGLDPEEVEAFLVTVASEFEQIVSNNNELRQHVVGLEEKIQEYKNMEKALRDTLLTAEKVMGDAKESAQREAALIIREAEVAAQRTKGRLHQEIAQLRHELGEAQRAKDAYVTRVRWLLRSHLEMIDAAAQDFSAVDAGYGLDSGASATSASPPPTATTARPRREDAAPAPSPAPHASHAATPTPPAPVADDLGDALRPVSADGTYDVGPTAYTAPGAPSGPPAAARP